MNSLSLSSFIYITAPLKSCYDDQIDYVNMFYKLLKKYLATSGYHYQHRTEIKTQVGSWLSVVCVFLNFKLICCKFSSCEILTLDRLWDSDFRSRRTFSDTCHSEEIVEIPLCAEINTKVFLKYWNKIL